MPEVDVGFEILNLVKGEILSMWEDHPQFCTDGTNPNKTEMYAHCIYLEGKSRIFNFHSRDSVCFGPLAGGTNTTQVLFVQISGGINDTGAQERLKYPDLITGLQLFL